MSSLPCSEICDGQPWAAGHHWHCCCRRGIACGWHSWRRHGHDSWRNGRGGGHIACGRSCHCHWWRHEAGGRHGHWRWHVACCRLLQHVRNAIPVHVRPCDSHHRSCHSWRSIRCWCWASHSDHLGWVWCSHLGDFHNLWWHCLSHAGHRNGCRGLLTWHSLHTWHGNNLLDGLCHWHWDNLLDNLRHCDLLGNWHVNNLLDDLNLRDLDCLLQLLDLCLDNGLLALDGLLDDLWLLYLNCLHLVECDSVHNSLCDLGNFDNLLLGLDLGYLDQLLLH
mmetsp:Transcript_14576/g.34429  ORF Transcript_14576/g.34429 Transcript_14576/m.34429 type:complete len:278 (-) Transcript_14576:38-871(-)